MNDCKKQKKFIEIYECIFLLLLVILQTALLELKQHKETKLVKKCNNCITILDRGEGILATVPDTRLAVAQFTLCLTCFE